MRVWVNRINNNIFYCTKKETKKKKFRYKSGARKFFLYLGGASTKISVSWTHKISANGGRWEGSSTTEDTVRFPADYGI